MNAPDIILFIVRPIAGGFLGAALFQAVERISLSRCDRTRAKAFAHAVCHVLALGVLMYQAARLDQLRKAQAPMVHKIE